MTRASVVASVKPGAEERSRTMTSEQTTADDQTIALVT
jgi:hypothetical protein